MSQTEETLADHRRRRLGDHLPPPGDPLGSDTADSDRRSLVVYQWRPGSGGGVRLSPVAESAAPPTASIEATILPDDLISLEQSPSPGTREDLPRRQSFRIRLPEGDIRWLDGAARGQSQDDGAWIWEGMAFDVTEQRQVSERLRFLAYHDPLTGLLNRSGFEERFNTARQDRARPGGLLAVMTIGLNRFDMINSTLGHAAGDAVLKSVARRLEEGAETAHTLARLSGNTFSLLLYSCEDRQTAGRHASRVLASFRSPVTVDGRAIEIAASAGISFYPLDGSDADTLLMNAAVALRHARGQDPGRHAFYEQKMNAHAQEIRGLEGRLNRALREHEFVAYYQPQRSLASGAIVAAEALVRWTDPRLGVITPTEFIGVAEDIGLIGGIGGEVLRAACLQARAWQDRFQDSPRVAVNISPRQFAHPRRLLSAVEAALGAADLAPDRLELELTESGLMAATAEARQVMRRLSHMGVSLAVDDFGMGYSSLDRLRRLPITKIKIDRAFVAGVTRDPRAAAIARAMIVLGKALDLVVAAEGVETAEQLSFLRAEGCDIVQGTLIGQTLPGADLERLLASQ